MAARRRRRPDGLKARSAMAKRSHMGGGTTVSAGAKLFVAAPYLWLLGFFLVPFLIVLKISLSETAIAQPPYVPVLDFAAGFRGIRDYVSGLSFSNYITIAGHDLYAFSYLKNLSDPPISTPHPPLCSVPPPSPTTLAPP